MSTDAQRRIASCLDGVLRADEDFARVRIVIDPGTGWPACPMATEVLDAGSWSLYLPEDDPEFVQLTVTPREVDPQNHDAADRWMAYYGRPKFARFAVLEVNTYKRLDEAYDGDEVRLVHPFRKGEGAILKELTARTDDLRRACEAVTKLAHPEVRAVGVDPFGIDVRVGLGVMRLEFPSPAFDAEQARERVGGVLA